MPQNGRHKPKPAPTLLSRGLALVDAFLQRLIGRGARSRSIIHMLHLLVVNIRRTQLTRMAAALSYRTIFGLLPVMVIGVLVVTAFSSRDQLHHVMKGVLDFTGLNRVVVVNPAPPAPDEMGPFPEVAEAAAGESRLDEWVTTQYDKIRSLPSGAIGFVGVLALLYAALSMLVEIEKAFNQVYNAPEGRSWMRRVTQYWTLLTLGIGLLIASFFAQERLLHLADSIPIFASLGGFKEFMLRLLGFVLTVGISTLAIFVIYMIVPNTRVQALPALIGAVTAAVLWESGKWGFTAYVSYSTGYSRVYGALAILPLFFLWIYITWLIVLLGLQLASALQTQRVTNADGFKFSVMATLGMIDEDASLHRVKIIDPAATLVVITAVAERFATGGTSDHCNISDSTGIDEQAVADMLERLAGAGLLLRVIDGENDTAYTLARPPEALSAAAVLKTGQEIVSLRPVHMLLLDNLSQVRMDTLAGKTVADLMDKPKEGGDAAPEAATPKPA